MNSSNRMKRRDFIASVAAMAVPAAMRGASAAAEDESFVTKFLADSLVIDGVVSTRPKTGDRPTERGAIKRQTGINVGGYTIGTVDNLTRENKRYAGFPDAFLVVRTAKDIETAWKSGRYGVIHYIQKPPVGGVNPASINGWYKLGLRLFQLAYSDGNDFAGGDRIGNDRGLSTVGKEAVKTLNELGMVVDLSHCGRRTTLEGAELSSFPVTANHANAEAVTGHYRNKSDEEVKAIAATGGVIGVTTIGRFLRRGEYKMEDRSTWGTIDDFIAHIDYLVDLVGVDHVGVSSDSWLDGAQVFDHDYTDELLNSYDRWKHLVARLHAKGYSREDLEKIMGQNFYRVYKRVLR